MKTWINVAILIVFVCYCSKSEAITIDVTAQPHTLGTKYQFTLTNDLSSQEDIFELYMTIPIDMGNIILYFSPTGWGDGFGSSLPYYGSLGAGMYIEWFADFGSELLYGLELPGFSFVSSQEINNILDASVNLTDPTITGFEEYGATLSLLSQSIPEPASLILFITMIIGLYRSKNRIK